MEYGDDAHPVVGLGKAEHVPGTGDGDGDGKQSEQTNVQPCYDALRQTWSELALLPNIFM